MRRRVALALTVALLGIGVAGASVAFGAKRASASPIRAAFYYGWFPDAWTQQGHYPFTNYTPTRGFYSTTKAVAKKQIADMKYAGLTAGIASWWGQGTSTDATTPALLSAASTTGFSWALYYEQEGYSNPTVSQIQTDLAYIKTNYATSAQFLKVGGKPVVFVYGDATDGCGMADRWTQANADHAFYLVLKVFAGYTSCASQPDSWHQYAPSKATDSQPGYSFSISPGFWKYGETPRLDRTTAQWSASVQAMVASGAPWQLVTTYNEWGEGTSVESAQEWAPKGGRGAYLKILHNLLTTTTTTSIGTTTTTGGTTTTGATTTTTGGTTTTIPQGQISHVVVIMEENRTWSGVGTGFSTMPYLHSLGGMYLPDWTETDTSENSLTQYIGLTSGKDDPDSIGNDCDPSSSCNTIADNLFRQGRAAGLTMRSYVEGPTSGCSASGNAAKHVPALYYWGGTDRNYCAAEVRPLGELDPANLPAFAMVTPNLCNDGHDCSNSTVDNWLSVHLAPILNSAEYQAGHVLVNIQWDEDRPVPNLALYKGIVSGANAAAGTHNRLLATWEDLLGLPRLTSATSLRGVYGL